jgi:hypothetical protein
MAKDHQHRFSFDELISAAFGRPTGGRTEPAWKPTKP